MKRLLPLIAFSFTACTKTVEVPIYCNYVPLPNVEYPSIDAITLQYSVDENGTVQHLKHELIIEMVNEIDLLQSMVGHKDLEIDYYRSNLENHNETCTNPIDRSTFNKRI
jgi:hypothetical protein